VFEVFTSEDGSTGAAVRPAPIDGLNVPLCFPSCEGRSADLQNPARFVCEAVGVAEPLHLVVRYDTGPAYLARRNQAGSNPLLKHDRLEATPGENHLCRSADGQAGRTLPVGTQIGEEGF
jgi:hypothetical protein